MKSVKEILSKADFNRQTGSSGGKAPYVSRLVERAFILMQSHCMGFDKLYADFGRLDFDKIQWHQAFLDEGITMDGQIDAAVKHLRQYAAKYSRPPCVGLFIAWMKDKPENYGLPDNDTAFQLAIKMNVQFSDFDPEDENTRLVLRHVLRAIGTHPFREMIPQESRKAFDYAYRVAIQQFVKGDLKPIPKAIPEKPLSHPGDKERGERARREAMRDIWNTLGRAAP